MPHISTVIRIFWISPGCNATVRSNTGIDGIYVSKSVYINFEIGERLVGAGLKSGCITTSTWVKCMYACQHRIAIFSRSTSPSIGGDISRRVPIALFVMKWDEVEQWHVSTDLKEVKQIFRLVPVRRRIFPKTVSKVCSVAKGPLLNSCREK